MSRRTYHTGTASPGAPTGPTLQGRAAPAQDAEGGPFSLPMSVDEGRALRRLLDHTATYGADGRHIEAVARRLARTIP